MIIPPTTGGTITGRGADIMIDLSKSYEYFKPESCKEKINIVGCGSVGATVAENLARLGLKNFVLWDFDTVSPHNIANQIFRAKDVGTKKVDALLDILKEIDPEIEQFVELKPEGWHGEMMTGYIILAVDSIEIRKQIVNAHMYSMMVKAVFDYRTLLESAQHYAADWSIMKHRQNLLNSMDFTDEEAADTTPVSACGFVLGVNPTVRFICAAGVANFVNFVNGKGLKLFISADPFAASILAA